MLSRFTAIVAALAVAAGVNTANAEIYSMYTGDLAVKPGTGTTAPSSLGIQLEVPGLLGVPGPSAQPGAPNGFIGSSLSGTAVVDMNLDASNTGTLFLNSSSFTVADVSYSQSGTLLGFFPYSIQLNLVGVGVAISGGPISVTNGVFSINANSIGQLSINAGKLTGLINLPSLGVNNSAIDLDFATDPVNLEFSSLGAVVIAGTADDDNGGSDKGVPDGSSHILGAPGVTGDNPLDTDGAEVNISFAGVSISTQLEVSDTVTLPAIIRLSGGVAVSVPEAGSMTLVGLAGIAGLAVARRRRSA